MRKPLSLLLLLAATPAGARRADEGGPPPEPPVKVTTFGLRDPEVPEETMVAIMRSLDAGLKRNTRLEMRDLDSRLAEFANEVPSEQIEAARAALKDGKKSLLELNIPGAIQKLHEAVTGLGKVMPYIKKQELAEAMASLAVAYVENGDKKNGRDYFIRLLTWRPDYVYDLQQFPSKYLSLFENAQREIEAARRGSIEINSEPPGAQAYVDGRYIGVTPCPAEGLIVGEHYVTYKKEGYRKAVTIGAVSPKRIVKVNTNLEQNEKYLLVQQALEQIKPTLGNDMGGEDMDNLKQVLLIEHAVFVKVTDKGGSKVEVDTLLYDLRTRRKLSRVLKTVPRTQAESQLAQLASNLYLNVNYDPELVAPKDAPPPPPLKRTPIYKTWYFWTGVAVLAVGASVITGVAVGSQAPGCLPDDACITIKQ